MKITNTSFSTAPNFDLPDKAYELLATEGFQVDADCITRLAQHVALIRKWNAYASLVSTSDLERLIENHVVDALSLAGRISAEGGPHLDIGSGGGFPAIPVKCILPRLPLILVERSAKKCGFLRKVIGALKLEPVHLIHGEFPAAAADIMPTSVTARAVERPQVLLPELAAWLPVGATFLSQVGNPAPYFGELFHVEPVADAWATSGLRRGSLHLVRRRGPASQ